MAETHVNKLHVIFIILFNRSTSVANVHGSFFFEWRACPLFNSLARSGGGGARRGGGFFSLFLGTWGIAPFLESFLLYAFTVERCHWGSNPTVHQAPGGFFHQSMLDRHKKLALYFSKLTALSD